MYKDLVVESIRLVSGCYRATDPESAEYEESVIVLMGGRPEHDWIEIWVHGGGLFLTQKFKSGIELDVYLYECDTCHEFVERTSLEKPKRNGDHLKPKNKYLTIKDVAIWVKS